jgi:hypothetical protein
MNHFNSLKDALRQASDLTGAAGAEAAYEVAKCLGKCFVSGAQISPGWENESLSLELALKATQHARWLTQRAKDQVTDIVVSEVEGVEEDDEFYEVDRRASVVLVRHELWCAELAIYEVADMLTRKGTEPGEFSSELCQLIEELSGLDVLMIQHVGVFARVAGLSLLSNLRASVKTKTLSESIPFPWWLDGDTEKAAEALEQERKRFFESLPDPKLIEQAVRRWRRRTM